MRRWSPLVLSLLTACTAQPNGPDPDQQAPESCEGGLELVQVTEGTLRTVWCRTSGGVAHGPYARVRLNGDTTTTLDRGQFLDGNPHGAWSRTLEGNRTLTANFDRGVADGAWRITDAGGATLSEHGYSVGRPCGDWRDNAVTTSLPACGSLSVPSEQAGRGWTGASCPNGTTRHGTDQPPYDVVSCVAANSTQLSGPLGTWVFRPGDAPGMKTLEGQASASARVGLWVEAYDDGIPHIVGAYDAQGRRTGEWFELFLDGTLRSRTTFVDGLPRGDAWTFHPNGQVAEHTTFSATGRHGTTTTWAANGSKTSEGAHANGLPNGSWSFWDDAGHLVAELNYDDGVLSGTGRYWRFLPDGSSEFDEGNHVFGLREGAWKTYSADRAYVLGTFTYEGDSREGLETRAYMSGARRWEGQHLHGLRTGTWTYWFESGAKEAEGAFGARGLEEGEWTYWYPDGSLRAKGPYFFGVQEGNWTEYDPDGSSRSVSYVNGEEQP